MPLTWGFAALPGCDQLHTHEVQGSPGRTAQVAGTRGQGQGQPCGFVQGLGPRYSPQVHSCEVHCPAMAQRNQLTRRTRTPRVPAGTPEKGNELDLGTPIPIDRAVMPAPGKRGGRASNEPEMLRWLGALEPGTTYQMGGGDSDGAHTVNRITQLRKVATKAGEFTIETSPIESGKRYLVFVTPGKPPATNGG